MTLKLIEVALPLKAINEATATEKRTTARLAHPANIHLWWARRPLAASRAILFAQLVDDPSAHPSVFSTPESIEIERNRLFKILEGLLDIDGPTEGALEQAKNEIVKSVGANIVVVDPFAGGGSIPIEAQRLGLEVGASDLNPVPILLNELMLKLLTFAENHEPIHPNETLVKTSGNGLSGLAEDVEWYARILNDRAKTETSINYPDIDHPEAKDRSPLAWMWARTIPCPNPACRVEAPLIRSFMLSKKKGRETWVDPVTDGPGDEVSFEVRKGPSPRVSRTIGRQGGVCVACDTAMPLSYIREQGRAGNMKSRLIAVVMLGDRRRIYLTPTSEQESAALSITHIDPFGTELAFNSRDIKVRNYGMTTHSSLFTARQITTLSTLTTLLPEIRKEILEDSEGDEKYADLITTILGICISKLADTNNSLVTWLLKDEVPAHLFTRHAIPMVWDFVESNMLGSSSGSLLQTAKATARNLNGKLINFKRGNANVEQANAATREYPKNVVICTDPPYFDNIGYADLADFFYVWLRLGLKDLYPNLFSTLLTPKMEELVATPFRFDGDQLAANEHFESGFRQVFARVKEKHHPQVPMTIFYAYKQEDEEDSESTGSSGAGATGWEKLLQGLVDTGLQVTATWPIRTEMGSRMIGMGTNSLASSVVLACRPRTETAGITDRQGFIRHLKQSLSEKLIELHSGGVLPVDMAQASIGPGMAVFTSYSRVLDGADQNMTVGTALQLINQALDELQSDHEADFDSDTRWAISWFEHAGMNSGPFGEALGFATARSIAMNAIERSGIIESRSGNVRLLDRSEYPDNWDPKSDKRITVWEVCQHLIRRLEVDGGSLAAAALLRQVGGLGDAARELSYRLYEIANRNGWSDEARAYNNLAAEWPDLVALAAQAPQDSTTLF